MLGREPVDARGQDRLRRRRDLQRLHGPGQTIGAALAHEGLRLHEGPHALFEEERVAFRALDQESPERIEFGVGAEERLEELSGALGRQWVDAKLGVVRLAAPGVLILGPIVDEDQDARGGQALEQRVEEGLRLAVDPVEVFEDQEQGLDTALGEEQAFDAVERALPALPRVACVPLGIVDRNFEQCEEGGHRRFERTVQREQLAGDLLADLALVVAVLDLEVGLEQVDDREIRRRLSVRHRAALEHEPPARAMRPHELEEEPGFPDTGLAHHRGELAAAGAGLLERAVKVLDLGVASDEPAERPCRHRLQPPPDRPGSRDLEDLDGIVHALDRHRTERRHVDVPFGQLERVRADQDRAGPCDLLHPCGEVRGLPDGRVVHAEIAADRADDHLTGVQPDADLDRYAVRAQELTLQRGEARLHPERRVARAYGVVLEGERRAEERHDAIAHHLVHGALVAVDSLHHPLEHRIDQLPSLLGITVGE